MMVRTQFGVDGGVIMAATDADNQIALEMNTRLVSYSIAFYAALLYAAFLIARSLKAAMYKFCISLFWLWVIMAFGLALVLGKELLLMVGAPFLNAPRVPHADLIALSQFNVLLIPTLALVCLLFWQLRGSPLWEALAADIKRASARA